MSNLDVPDAAADLLDVEEEEFDSEEAYREWVDGRLAELEAALAETDDRLGDQGDRVEDHGDRLDALSSWVESVEDAAYHAERKAEEAERMAAWGGLGYEDRIARVVTELVSRARASAGDGAHITTTTEDCEDMQGNRYTRDGVVDLFEGGVSERTARNYVDDLAACAGLYAEEGSRGGWGGGSEPKRLKLNLAEFFAAYGSEWDGDDLAADMEVSDAR